MSQVTCYSGNEHPIYGLVLVDITTTVDKAGERGGRGGRGGQNTWGPDWLGGAEILIKHLVIVLLSRGLGARNA